MHGQNHIKATHTRFNIYELKDFGLAGCCVVSLDDRIQEFGLFDT